MGWVVFYFCGVGGRWGWIIWGVRILCWFWGECGFLVVVCFFCLVRFVFCFFLGGSCSGKEKGEK